MSKRKEGCRPKAAPFNVIRPCRNSYAIGLGYVLTVIYAGLTPVLSHIRSERYSSVISLSLFLSSLHYFSFQKQLELRFCADWMQCVSLYEFIHILS